MALHSVKRRSNRKVVRSVTILRSRRRTVSFIPVKEDRVPHQNADLSPWFLMDTPK